MDVNIEIGSGNGITTSIVVEHRDFKGVIDPVVPFVQPPRHALPTALSETLNPPPHPGSVRYSWTRV